MRLCADGCAAQNKNSTMIGMSSKWLLTEAPLNINKVEITFPVVGHSFLPPVRIFGVIEKEIRKKEVTVDPQEYNDIIGKHGIVFSFGSEDEPLEDWKKETDKILRSPVNWHFKFSPCKRFILRRSALKEQVTVIKRP